VGVAAALALASCGTDTGVAPQPVDNSATLSLVSRAEIVRTPPNSPQRTVLTWWRLAQFTVVHDSIALFTHAAQAQLRKADYAGVLVDFVGPWIRNGRPQVQRVEYPTRRHALVFMRTVFREPISLDLFHVEATPLALSLDLTRHGWRLSDPTWVIDRGKSLHSASVITTTTTHT